MTFCETRSSRKGKTQVTPAEFGRVNVRGSIDRQLLRSPRCRAILCGCKRDLRRACVRVEPERRATVLSVSACVSRLTAVVGTILSEMLSPAARACGLSRCVPHGSRTRRGLHAVACFVG